MDQNIMKALYSRETFLHVFDNHPEMICIIDVSGHVISVNKMTGMLGYNSEEIVGKFNDFFTEADLKVTTQNFNKTLNGMSVSYDAALLHKDGYEVQASVTCIPIKASDKVIGALAITKDISELKLKEAALKNVKNELNLAQMTANIGSWDSDLRNGKIFWSKQIYRIMGINNSDGYFVPTYDKFIAMIHPEDRHRMDKTVKQALINKSSYQIEYRMIRQDGRERNILEKADVVLDENNEPCRLIGVVHDITDKKVAEEQLKQSEEQFKNVYSNINAGVWSKDVIAGKFRFISAGVEQICGFSSEEFIKKRMKWEQIIIPEDVPQYNALQDMLITGKSLHHEYRIIHKNGDIRWIHEDTIPITNDIGEVIRLTGILTDVTDKKNAEEKMVYLAHHDYLTDLPNRRSFDLELSSLIKRSKDNGTEFSVVYLDMDGFKRINDSLGHSVGDELLKHISRRLEKLAGENFVYRMSGDEFTMLITNYNSVEELIHFAKWIVNEVKKPFLIQDYELFITTSIGISTYPSDGIDAETLLRNADAALYRAKELGRDNYQIYLPSQNIETYKSFLLEKDLRHALANDQFRIHYQPRVDVKTNKVVSAEALIRWEHPEWGLVSPGEFIPLAEESGLIIDIGNWVILNVCKQMKKWERNRVIPISINISSKSFLKSNWISDLTLIVKETGLDPKLLEFEITENAIMQNEEVVQKTAKLVKDLGIKLSLDDFGTGFSSITHLKHFNFDFIKIDRSFIQNITANKQDDILTKSIIQMAHGLQMKVVAEGVETTEQLRRLRELDCDELQGYLFSKPVGESEFQRILNEGIAYPDTSKSSAPPVENRRRFFRINLPHPLLADMTITKIKGKTISLGQTKIVVDNIGPGGVHFLSHIKMPVQPDITLKIMTEILGQPFKVEGHIVWQGEWADHIYEYGLEFSVNENEREKIFTLLNKLNNEILKSPRFQDSLLVEDKKQYIISIKS